MDEKWTSFRYVSSNSKSRMKTEEIKEQISKGAIKVINKEMIEGLPKAKQEP